MLFLLLSLLYGSDQQGDTVDLISAPQSSLLAS